MSFAGRLVGEIMPIAESLKKLQMLVAKGLERWGDPPLIGYKPSLIFVVRDKEEVTGFSAIRKAGHDPEKALIFGYAFDPLPADSVRSALLGPISNSRN